MINQWFPNGTATEMGKRQTHRKRVRFISQWVGCQLTLGSVKVKVVVGLVIPNVGPKLSIARMIAHSTDQNYIPPSKPNAAHGYL